MEILYIILAFILGAVLAYFILKSSSVSRKSYEELQQNFIKKDADFSNAESKILEILEQLKEEKNTNASQAEILNQLQNELAKISAENNAQNQKIAEQAELNQKQNAEIKDLQLEKNNLIAIKSELSAQNENLQKLLDTQKEEIVKIQEEAKLQFENLANKILEEKTLKFTEQNQQNLKNILNPLQEKITDFEKKVENTHKESIDYHAALRQQILGLLLVTLTLIFLLLLGLLLQERWM